MIQKITNNKTRLKEPGILLGTTKNTRYLEADHIGDYKKQKIGEQNIKYTIQRPQSCIYQASTSHIQRSSEESQPEIH